MILSSYIVKYISKVCILKNDILHKVEKEIHIKALCIKSGLLLCCRLKVIFTF